MKKYFAAVLLALVLFSCGSTSQRATSEKRVVRKKCGEEPKVYDPKTEFNQLRNLNGLSYSYAYTMIFDRTDSLQREVVRRTNGEVARTLVELSLPETSLLPDDILSRKNYNEIMFNTSDIKWYSRKKTSVGNLLINTDKEKQLFVEIRSYGFHSKIKNKVNIFVFNTKSSTLLYHDQIEYYCPIDDKEAYTKVLNYALEKLKTRVKPS